MSSKKGSSEKVLEAGTLGRTVMTTATMVTATDIHAHCEWPACTSVKMYVPQNSLVE